MHMHHEPVAPPDAPPAERLRMPRHTQAYWVSAFLATLILLYWTDVAPTLFGQPTDLVAGLFGGMLIWYGAATSLMSGVIGADVALAVACAASIAIDPITAAVVAFMAFFGEALEGLASGRAHRAISRLVELSPPIAHVLHTDHVHDVPVEQVSVGDRVIVRPGERVPVDGEVIAGESALDESSLTGESIPVERRAGDPVFAGTFNQLGALTVRADRVGEETSLGQVIRLVADAQANKGQGERTADRYARRYFLPIVAVAAMGTWLWTGETLNAVAVLVIACPCALVLATPAAVLAAMGRLAREGVVVKGGAVFERLARVTTFAFDKTGTVTEGRAVVRRVVCLTALDEADVLRLAAAAEKGSEHVFARAVVDETRRRELAPIDAVEAFQARPGFGVEAVVDGRRVLVGNARLLAEEGIALDERARAELRALEEQGTTALFVARSSPDEVVAVIGVADTLRGDAHDALHTLHHAGVERMLLLTGDRQAVADDIAARLHVDEVRAEMLPVDKAEVIRARQMTGEHVAMVGDGVNDAPALAVADVGLAIGGPGRDITAEAADVVLMGEPLAPLALTLDVSRKTARVIRQNITVFAIGLNTVAIGLAAAGLLPPMEAAVAHEIGSLAVLLNALRLLFVGRWGDLRPVRAWHRFTHALGHLRHDAQHVKQDLGHWASAHRRVLLRRGLPVCTAAAWLATGVRIVDVDEVMVVQRFGRAVATCDPGLHLRMPWPIETKRRMRPDAIRTATVGAPLRTDLPDNGIFAIEWETVHPGQPASAEGMMTGDIWQGDPADGSDQIASKLVQISAVVHYTVDDPTAYLLDVRSPDAVVLTTAESILRELVAGHRLDAVLADRRGEISDQCAQQLRTRLADYKTGVAVRSVVLLDVHPEPGKERMNVIEAYRDAARAQAEQKETVYGAHADAHRLLAEARGRRATELASAHSAGALRTAVAYGQAERFNAQRRAFRAYPELERWRVFLETVRTKLAGKRKLILDPTLEGRQQLFLAGGTSPLSLTPLLNRASSEPDPAFAGEEEHP